MAAPKLRFKAFDENWEKVKFSEKFNFHSTNSYSRALLSENGEIMNIHYGDIHTKFSMLFNVTKEQVPFLSDEVDIQKISQNQFLQVGDLVIADASEDYKDIGKTIEIVNLDNQKIVAGLHTYIARPNHPFALGFSGYLMQTFEVREQIKKLATGISVLGISKTNLGKVELRIPYLEEQTKIASFLSAVDEKITQLSQKLHLLNQYKQGMMQKLFSQQIRFKADDGSEFDEWKKQPLNHYLYTSKLKNKDLKFTKEDVLSVSGELGIVNQIDLLGRSYAGVSVAPYGVVEVNDIVYTKSPLKSNPYGIIKVNLGKAGIVSTLYAVYKCKENIIPKLIEYYFQSDSKLNQLLKPLVKKGAKNDMKVNNDHVLTGKVIFPTSLEEQVKIVNFLSTIDQKIDVVSKQLEQAKLWKKGLLQQMFV